MGAQLKILYVDDDEDEHVLMRGCLAGTKFNLVTTLDPQQLERLLQVENPDLLLLDYNLGEIDGAEVLRKIRQKFPDLKVAIITTYNIKPEKLEGLAATLMAKGMDSGEFIQEIGVLFN